MTIGAVRQQRTAEMKNHYLRSCIYPSKLDGKKKENNATMMVVDYDVHRSGTQYGTDRKKSTLEVQLGAQLRSNMHFWFELMRKMMYVDG